MVPLGLKFFPQFVRATCRFRDYEPYKVTPKSLTKWLSQFKVSDTHSVIALLDSVIYISKKQTKRILIDLNETLLRRIELDGMSAKNIIYVQMHDPGSSSAAILNLIRDSALLEQRGCKFIDWRDVRKLNDLTDELESGVIIYVDDFSGSGNQFCGVRDYLADHIVGSFVEYFLLVSICEEALYELGKRGVEALSGPVHSKADRPLHPNCGKLDRTTKSRLTELSFEIDNKGGLGYRELATMVVLYRNAPNSVPVILRGNKNQHFVGILPRTTDLPVPNN